MSLSRSEQARINGAKSRGPVTSEGKTISSMNAFKHGRYSNPAPVLRIEDESAFRELQVAYESQFVPRSPIERRLVLELASVDWQLTRWRTIETAQIDRTYDLRAPADPGIDPLAILSAALEASVNESRFLPYIAPHRPTPRGTQQRPAYPPHPPPHLPTARRPTPRNREPGPNSQRFRFRKTLRNKVVSD